jgi:4-amino-4-deoxy-L-arabinose transferase-like glycosyltransferase
MASDAPPLRSVVEGQNGAPSDAPRQPTKLAGAVWWAAAGVVALELAVSARYGFHRDELYFIACAHRLAFGYVDQGPLAPAVARVAIGLFGTSPSSVRLFPALAGGAVVVGTGLTASALGGGRFAQLLAAVAMACAPITLGPAHLAGTTVYDLAAWTFTVWLVVRAVMLHRPRSWLAAGAVVGLGLENKDLLVLLLVALVVGLLLTPSRSVLATPWPWVGMSIAVLLWMPNLVWELTHGTPALAMDRSLAAEHSALSDYVGFLPAQIILGGLFAAPMLIVGLADLVRRRPFRFIAVAAALVLVYVFATIPGRTYYTAGFLPLVFVLGAIRIEERGANARRRLWLGAPVVGLVLTVSFILPVLPLSTFAQLRAVHTINYDLGETVGWPDLTQQVATVYDALPPAERRKASVFTSNYGEAGAIALYGPALGLPVPLSGHNTYWLWGPGAGDDQVVIAVGAVEQLRPHFAQCRYVATIHSPDDVNNDENGTPIGICTGPRGAWSSFWGSLRNYG